MSIKPVFCAISALSVVACSSSDPSVGNAGTGGAGTPSNSGGFTAVVGGAPSKGGAVGAGGVAASTGGTNTTVMTGGASAVGGKTATGGAATAGGNISVGGTSATGGSNPTGGKATAGGSSAAGSPSATGGISVGGNQATGGNGGIGGIGGTTVGGSATGGAAPGGTSGLQVLTDTNRDGKIDASDTANNTDWAWKGKGAFFIANVDDDDSDKKSDAADQAVNGTNDEKDLARVIIRVGSDALAKAKSISVSATAGATQLHLFQKSGTTWTTVSGALSQLSAESELGLEATQFANVGWDGFAVLKVDLLDGTTVVESQSVKLRVAPWLMLPSSAKTELVYVIGGSTGNAMRTGIDAALQKKGLPACQTPTPSGQDQWYQDTMEIGYTQLPGSAPMHVVMNSARQTQNNVAPMLLAPDFGFIAVGTSRSLGSMGGDYWMDWMGNLEVTHPMPGYPLGRIYYGKSTATTFSPTIVKFLEAQELQKPFAFNTEWLVIQHVDEIVSFVVDKDGKPKMIVASPSAANDVLKTGYDADQQRIQGYMNDTIALLKTEIGITDADIVQLPIYFEGSGQDFGSKWTDPVNSIFVNGTFIIGQTDVPAAIKTNIESRFTALGIEVAWVDDANYQSGGGNVHCGTNTKKTPICTNFADCIP